jgi:hypothetical protein
MRVRIPRPLVFGVLFFFLPGALCERSAVADPVMMALLPSEGTKNAAPVTPPGPSSGALEATTAPAPAPPPARKPLYRRWWLWTIVGAVIAQGALVGAIRATPAEPFRPTIDEPNPPSTGLVRF